MDTPYILFIFLSFGAAIVSAVFGIGTALIVLALGAHILPVKETIALAAVLFSATTITKTIIFGRHIDWKVASMMALASLPFSYLGAMFLADFPAEALKRLLGFMVLLYLGLSVFKLFPGFRINTAGLVAGSAAYGFLSGLLGSGNLIKAIMFREMNVTKEAFVGAMAATSVLANIAKIIAYSNADLLHGGLKFQMISLVLVAICAVLIGRYLLRGISISQFSTGFQIVLALSALGLLF